MHTQNTKYICVLLHVCKLARALHSPQARLICTPCMLCTYHAMVLVWCAEAEGRDRLEIITMHSAKDLHAFVRSIVILPAPQAQTASWETPTPHTTSGQRRRWRASMQIAGKSSMSAMCWASVGTCRDVHGPQQRDVDQCLHHFRF